MHITLEASNIVAINRVFNEDTLETSPKIKFLTKIVGPTGLSPLVEGDSLYSTRKVVVGVEVWKTGVSDALSVLNIGAATISKIIVANRDGESEEFPVNGNSSAAEQMERCGFKIAAWDYTLTVLETEGGNKVYVFIGTDQETEKAIQEQEAEALRLLGIAQDKQVNQMLEGFV